MARRLGRFLRDDLEGIPPYQRYLYAALLAVLGLIFRAVVLPPHPPFVFLPLFPMVMITALLLGAGPGLLTAVLCVLGAQFAFIDEAEHLAGVSKWVPLSIFLAFSGILCLLARVTRSAARFNEQLVAEHQAILETHLIGMYRATGRRIIWANKAFAQMFGYQPEELIGQSTRMLYNNDEEYEEWGRRFREIAQTGVVLRGESSRPRRDGSIGWFARSVGAVSRGGEVDVVGICVDVSARRAAAEELARSQERLSRIFSAMAESVVLCDRNGTIIEANRVACEFAGLPREKLLGINIFDRTVAQLDEHGAEIPAEKLGGWNTLRTGKPSQGEIIGIGRPDGIRWVSANCLPVHAADGSVDGMVATMTDITDYRKLQLSLRQSQAESHERIRKLAQSLETVREEERRAVAIALHEGIAQDLFGAKLSVEQLAVHTPGRAGATAACNDVAQAIRRCMDSTRQLANDLRPEGLVHAGFMYVLRQHAQHFCARAGLALHLAELTPVPPLDESSGLALFRAAQEALTNIAKHAQAKTVWIDVEADEERIALAIRDDGVGIAPESMQKVGSLGLLGIRERFIGMGGGVHIERLQPRGTVIRLYLPLRSARPQDAAIAHGSER